MVEKFNKLVKEDQMLIYQEKFKETRSLMLMENPRLAGRYFISSYVSGLKEELQSTLRMHEPLTLNHAFELVLQPKSSLFTTQSAPD